MQTPTGTVALFVDGTQVYGGALDSSGNYSLGYGGLSAGSHNVSVQYSGDANFAPGTSSVLVEVVDGPTQPAPSSVSIASNENPSNVGDAVTFSGGVTAAPPGKPGTTWAVKQ